MKTSSKTKISILELVFPPFSSQEAVWFRNEPSIERHLRQSDFYMIGGKPECFFVNINLNENTYCIEFDIEMKGNIVSSGKINIRHLPFIAHLTMGSYKIRCQKKFIEFSDLDKENEKGLVIERFTPDNIFWYRSKYMKGIEGLDNYQELLKFDLLYVGIAKVGDSYDRLIKKGHTARMDILSNETPRYLSSRVTDEIFLFLFKINPLIFSTFNGNHNFTDHDINPTYDNKKIVADAEKAFVSLLLPQYNIVKFRNYPQSQDGLYDSGLDRYGYSISESLTFNTPHGTIKGWHDYLDIGISNEADLIFVEGDNVKLFISGEDFPATPA